MGFDVAGRSSIEAPTSSLIGANHHLIIVMHTTSATTPAEPTSGDFDAMQVMLSAAGIELDVEPEPLPSRVLIETCVHEVAHAVVDCLLGGFRAEANVYPAIGTDDERYAWLGYTERLAQVAEPAYAEHRRVSGLAGEAAVWTYRTGLSEPVVLGFHLQAAMASKGHTLGRMSGSDRSMAAGHTATDVEVLTLLFERSWPLIGDIAMRLAKLAARNPDKSVSVTLALRTAPQFKVSEPVSLAPEVFAARLEEAARLVNAGTNMDGAACAEFFAPVVPEQCRAFVEWAAQEAVPPAGAENALLLVIGHLLVDELAWRCQWPDSVARTMLSDAVARAAQREPQQDTAGAVPA